MKTEDLLNIPTLRRVVEDGLPVVDPIEALDEGEILDVRWEPWRASLGAVLRLVSDAGGGTGVVVARRVQRLEYTSSFERNFVGHRAIGRVTMSLNDGGLSAAFPISKRESVRIECEALALVVGDGFIDGAPAAIPDYTSMGEEQLERAQPAWRFSFKPRGIVVFGDLARSVETGR